MGGLEVTREILPEADEFWNTLEAEAPLLFYQTRGLSTPLMFKKLALELGGKFNPDSAKDYQRLTRAVKRYGKQT